jgi:hypothetical protein
VRKERVCENKRYPALRRHERDSSIDAAFKNDILGRIFGISRRDALACTQLSRSRDSDRTSDTHYTIAYIYFNEPFITRLDSCPKCAF